MNASTASANKGVLDLARTEFERAMQRNIKGLGYFASPNPVLGATPKDTLIARGPLRLYHYRSFVDEVYRVPVLLVMATTNRGYIFDMVPGQSFVEFLLHAGYDVFMIDWEAPRPDERALSMEDYVQRFLPECVARVKTETRENDLSVIGYCFGGVLSLLWAALHPDAGLKNLITFTVPIDFKKMDAFQAWSDRRFFDVDRLVASFGQCPTDMLYTAFSMLRPGAQIAGNIRLWDNMWNDEFVKSYRMFDRWAADMLPLAGEYFRQTVQKLLWDNDLFERRMTVGGQLVDLERITVPFLHVTAEHDHIVPGAASAPLIDMVGSTDKQHIVIKGGHVSLVAGGNAVRRLWPQIDTWLGGKSI
jgi:polyhydroxyalkanoate synthase subunit PhaC